MPRRRRNTAATRTNSQRSIPADDGEETDSEQMVSSQSQVPRVLQHVPFPDKLDLTDESTREYNWTLFRQIWDNYEISSQLLMQNARCRTATLLTCFTPSALKIYNSIDFKNETERTNIDVVLQKMAEVCKGFVNITYERYVFNTRSQGPDEPITDYYSALLHLSKTCAFGDLAESLIRDRIIVGLNSSAIRKRLLLEKELTLAKCLDIARSVEATQTRIEKMAFTSKSDVNYVKTKSPHHKYSQNTSSDTKSLMKQQQTNQAFKTCGYCGARPGHNRKSCPAKDTTCSKCRKVGHWPEVCRSQRKGIRLVQEDYTQDEVSAEEDCDDFLFLGTVSKDNGVDENTGFATVYIDGNEMRMRIDTGADVDVLPQWFYDEHLKHFKLEKPGSVLKGPSRETLQTSGFIRCPVQSKSGITITPEIYILPRSTALLSKASSIQLKLVKFVGNITEKYSKLFHGLGVMAEPYDITIKPEIKPYAVLAPRRIPLPLMKAVKQELDRLEGLQVIRRVTEPSDWCSPLVVVPKKQGAVRLCVDYTELNKAVQRERHILPSVDHTLGQLGGAKVFSKLDANSGFHQIRLTSESQHLTTFITPHGRYCFNRLPFGINSGPEHFQRQLHRILEGLAGVVCLMDDMVVYGSTLTEHDARLEAVLQRLQEANITLNKEKCAFRTSTVSFLGHTISEGRLKPDDSKLQAILSMTTPSNLTELRRFLGMLNQLTKFLPHLAASTAPLRSLLSSKNDWAWDSSHTKVFQEIKQILCSSEVLVLYDPSRPTKVSSDSSSYGIGAVLQQKVGENWCPVAYASRSLSQTEQRYAMVEKEALAACWACTKFHDFLLGLPSFILETDHKPLLALLGSKAIGDLPPRIQRIRMRMMQYSYVVQYTSGKDLYTADCLSRAPVASADQSEEEFVYQIQVYADQAKANIPASDIRLAQISEAQNQDEECRQLQVYIAQGWPDNKLDLPIDIQKYWAYHPYITNLDNIVMYNDRLLIPKLLRQEMLQKLHEGHQGITKCRQRLRQSVWWPGANNQLQQLIQDCEICSKMASRRMEPLESSRFPELPWQHIATDIMELKNRKYLVLIDYYSRYMELQLLENLSSSGVVINHMKSIFARHGIPQVVTSDNGPQFAASEFKKFANEYGFHHHTSSPQHPSGNGEAERAVRTAKQLLEGAPDPYLALLAYRSTPLKNGYSPAELLFGRKLRTNIPQTAAFLTPDLPDQVRLRQFEETYRKKQEDSFNSRHGTFDLQVLKAGDRVHIRDRSEDGKIIQQLHNRSYEVATHSGNYRRNRADLIKLKGSQDTVVSQKQVDHKNNQVDNDGAHSQGTSVYRPDTADIRAGATRDQQAREGRYRRVVNKPVKYKDYV